ncbi:hypothetical protein [Bacillus aquiflavi]|uniref:hypothetical protein n=1 Tax=Bacillus aquiflavi TaxID=2672567 RepID=UPI001FE6A3F2|nr:hypothetical protein [Bacillus aquiflavi]
MIKLYFLNECLGEIKNISVENMWMNGKLIHNKNINEDYETWLEDKYWFMIDDKKRNIFTRCLF